MEEIEEIKEILRRFGWFVFLGIFTVAISGYVAFKIIGG